MREGIKRDRRVSECWIIFRVRGQASGKPAVMMETLSAPFQASTQRRDGRRGEGDGGDGTEDKGEKDGEKEVKVVGGGETEVEREEEKEVKTQTEEENSDERKDGEE